MRSKKLAPLVKLRQYQLEVEQWKLADRQKEELEALREVEGMDRRLISTYGEGRLPINPAEASHRYQYIRETIALREISKRKLAVARHATAEQLQVVLDRQKKREMLTRLYDKALKAEHEAYDKQERKLLDDIAQAGHLRKEVQAV